MTKPGNSDQPENEKTEAVPAGSETPAEPARAKPDPPKRERPKRERPVMPTAREAVSGITGKPVPTVVRWGFYLVLAAAVLSVLVALLWVVQKNNLIDQQVELAAERGERIDRTRIEQGVTNLLWMLVIAKVIFGVFQTLFVWKAKEGIRRARMQLLIATVIIVIFCYLLALATLDLIPGLLLAIGTAMLYLPQARDYYPPRQPVR